MSIITFSHFVQILFPLPIKQIERGTNDHIILFHIEVVGSY